MIKAVIFDMDGVIIDSEPLWEKSTQIYFAKLGKKLPTGNSFGHFIDVNFRGRRQKEVVAILKKKFKIKGNFDSIMADRMQILFEVFDRELKLMPGILLLIKKLNKERIPMVVASSSPTKVINYALRRFKIRPYFKKVVAGIDAKRSKPAPDIFLLASKSFGKIKPEKILVIEDSYSGIIAAKRAGMKCLAICHPYADKKLFKMADLVVTTFRSLKIENVLKI